MKTINLLLLVSLFFTFNVKAESVLTQEELLTIAKQVLKEFTEANPGHAGHLTGFKVWRSGQDGKVKLYLDHGGHEMESDYLCVRQANRFECREE